MINLPAEIECDECGACAPTIVRMVMLATPDGRPAGLSQSPIIPEGWRLASKQQAIISATTVTGPQRVLQRCHDCVAKDAVAQ